MQFNISIKLSVLFLGTKVLLDNIRNNQRRDDQGRRRAREKVVISSKTTSKR